MNARQFYDLADKLVRDAASAAPEYRTAASRGYYACFHVAREFFIALDVAAPTGLGAHGHLPIGLQHSRDGDVIKAGSALSTLYTWRRAADYDLANLQAERQARAQDAVDTATQVLILLGKCLADPARKAQVRAELRTWAGTSIGRSLGFRPA